MQRNATRMQRKKQGERRKGDITYTEERIEAVLVVETLLRRLGKVTLEANLTWENNHVIRKEEESNAWWACDIERGDSNIP